MVVILLHYCLEILPDLGFSSSRNILDCLEILLELLEFAEFHIYVIDVFRNFTNTVEDRLLFIEILLTACLLCGKISRTFLFEFGIHRLEFRFFRIGNRRKITGIITRLYKSVDLLHRLAAADIEKRLLDGCHLPVGIHTVFSQYRAHRFVKLSFAHVMIINRSLFCRFIFHAVCRLGNIFCRRSLYCTRFGGSGVDQFFCGNCLFKLVHINIVIVFALLPPLCGNRHIYHDSSPPWERQCKNQRQIYGFNLT